MLQSKDEELSYNIMNLKSKLQKYKYDIEQTLLFGMERDDFLQKKEMCKNIVEQLKKLENELKNQQK